MRREAEAFAAGRRALAVIPRWLWMLAILTGIALITTTITLLLQG